MLQRVLEFDSFYQKTCKNLKHVNESETCQRIFSCLFLSTGATVIKVLDTISNRK